MKLSAFLNKPRWQSKEAAVRRAGVADDDDADLLARLGTIAREDPDAGVRAAALKRVADPALAQRLSQEDADADVRAEARRLWLELLAGTHPRAPSVAERERLLRAQDDTALIEHIVRTAPEPAMRGAALARVTRAALLAERAVSDPSPELRLAALERIDDEAALERIAERTRKTDKRISRGARERADALRIARGNEGAVDALARTLCERLEKLVRTPQGIEAEAAIDVQWSTVEPRVGDALRSRYQTARRLLAAAREAPATSAETVEETTSAPAAAVEETRDGTPLVEAVAPSVTDPEIGVSEATEAAPEATAPASDAEPVIAQESVDAPPAAAREDRKHAEQQRSARLREIEDAIVAFESAVAEGIVARAHATHATIVALRKTERAPLSRALQTRLAEAERQYAELSRWQHWSDNQRRRQLCESIEVLAGSGLHPDAIATRVREAQAEWSRLDAAEGHAAGQAMHGWARRFHSACRHALEPAKSYFRKRQELRKTQAQAIGSSLEQVRALPDDCEDWPLIAKTRHAIVDALRALDRVDPHERKTLARDLKQALNGLDARLAAHHAAIESAKAALIGEAEALTAGEVPRGAPAAARALQQRWREVGNGRRDRDQAQWKTFRAALDAVFAKLDTERSERVARDADTRTRAAALCAEIEDLAKNDGAPRAAIARLESEWDALNVRDEALARRVRAAQAMLRDADLRRERVSRRNPYDAWLARYRLCRAAETGGAPDEMRAAWSASADADIAATELAARFERAIGGDTTHVEPDDDGAREILVRMEIFAGVDSPSEDHDRRRALQIERLSARMRGGAAQTPHQELAALLTRWTGLAAIPEPLDTRFERALAAAVETLP